MAENKRVTGVKKTIYRGYNSIYNWCTLLLNCIFWDANPLLRMPVTTSSVEDFRRKWP